MAVMIVVVVVCGCISMDLWNWDIEFKGVEYPVV